jgi:hypothetical protein
MVSGMVLPRAGCVHIELARSLYLFVLTHDLVRKVGPLFGIML